MAYYRQNKNFISKNGLTPQDNREIGRLTYALFHVIIFFIAYKIWGMSMFEEVWFYLMHLSAFFLTKVFLVKIKVWVY